MINVNGRKARYICSECLDGASATKMGFCASCKAVGSMIENPEYGKKKNSKSYTKNAGDFVSSLPTKVGDVKIEGQYRYDTLFTELNRVLGKDDSHGFEGLTKGSVTLIAGDPGIGKSTLLLQVANNLSEDNNVLYVSAEENMNQIKARADRLGVGNGDYYLYHEKDFGKIKTVIEDKKPDILIIDSIQTVFTDEIDGKVGGSAQVTGIATNIVDICKTTGITAFVVGHVRKDSEVAGPNTLAHLVDTVLHFEGDEFRDYRIVRSGKNRYGKSGEIGVFEMREDGIHEVGDSAKYFIKEVENEAGSAISCIMEGSRPILIETQSLCIPSVFSNPKRTPEGISYNKLAIMSAIIQRTIKGGDNLSEMDIYFKIASGLKVNDPALDLAIAMSIISSLKGPLPSNTVYIGELSFTGDLRSVSSIESRVTECVRLGVDKVYIPKHQLGLFKDNKEVKDHVVGIKNIKEIDI